MTNLYKLVNKFSNKNIVTPHEKKHLHAYNVH